MIGMRTLKRAAIETNIGVKIIWHPYMINPNIAPEGEEMKDYITNKCGPEALARYFRPDNPLEMAGRKVGIAFNINRRMVSSCNAHRLFMWCMSVCPERAELLIEAILHAYYVEGKDISSPTVLGKIAESVGLNPRDAFFILNSTAFLQDVLDRDSAAKSKMRVSGVPFFTISYQSRRRPFHFAGAQPVDAMCNILREASQTV